MEFLLLLAIPLLGFAFSGSDDHNDDPEPEQPGDTLSGGESNDTLLGTTGADVISGNGGDDSLVGFAGDDTIRGGFGNDIVDGHLGDDYVNGGADDDTVLGYFGDDTLLGGRGDDVVLGEEGDDSIDLGDGNDTNWVSPEISQDAFAYGQLGDDQVFGGAGNDSIWDYAGENTLDGGDGDDEISATDNQLDGWETADDAADQVSGGAGDDVLVGDDGDTLLGGAGDDLMVTVHERDEAEAVTVGDYDGNADSLELHVDSAIADLTQWTLFSQTDTATGNVTLGLENNTDPAQTIELAYLTNATNFAIAQVTLIQN
ncbi:hypothetical protein GCM10010873_24290 [Cypionkella aquatica]|uniref:Calcium-binding protein n=1 Tax=Cypionkella aquatica TaxID=1756042 RepID=A0AA37X2F2_9RHOB|nr:calcium-binding protein [Cypionkella aquatica]GLS87455.1 hypothetical protein GCM10010873_24290 [Cypionkella aquatica]